MSTEQIPRAYSLRRVLTLLMVLCILNGAAFIVGTIFLHGDAVNGKHDGGHYYLFGYLPAVHSKGYTEVSPAAYRYSLYHARSAMIAGLLIPILILWQRRLGARPKEGPNDALHATAAPPGG